MRRGGAAAAIVDFFNRRAVDYDREYDADTPAGFALRVRRQKVLQLFDRPGGDVLDVGCGPAVMAGEMIARGCRFWGVDPSASMLAIAESRYQPSERIQFSIGDAEHLTFPDGRFDAVLCMGVFDSIRDGQQAVLEMMRVLKPGGTLIFTVTNLLSPYAWWKNYAFYPAVEYWQELRIRLGWWTPPPGRRRTGKCRSLYSRRDAERLVRCAGGEISCIVPYYFNIFISPLDEMLPRTALRVTRKWEQWGRLEWMAAGWIVKARKALP